MDTGQARRLFDPLSGALAYIEVEGRDKDLAIGSAFHVGEGVFVTARHVVEGRAIQEVRMTETFNVEPTEEEAATVKAFTVHGPIYNVNNGVINITAGPYFHEDPRVDVAAFEASEIDPRTPVVPLGTHLDEYLGPSDFILTEAIVLGYPPIPMTTRPVLVGARAEVNALALLYDAPNVHLILSAIARGGFSGGVAFSEDNYALGLVTRSLVTEKGSVESGYMAVLGVQPIYECLAQNRMLPAVQSDTWDGHWNTDYLTLTGPGNSLGPLAGLPLGELRHTIATVTAMISVFNDGKRSNVKISCDSPDHQDAAIHAALSVLADRVGGSNADGARSHTIHVVSVGELMDDTAHKAAQAASGVLLKLGYRPIKRTEEAYKLLPPADQPTPTG